MTNSSDGRADGLPGEQPALPKPWRPQWPTWLTPPVFISCLALLVSGGTFYFNLVDQRDHVVALWDGTPEVFAPGFSSQNTDGRALGMKDPFNFTFLNLGNRVAIILPVEAFFFVLERDHPSDCADPSPIPSKLKINSTSTVLKPNEAATLSLPVTDFSSRDVVASKIDGEVWHFRRGGHPFIDGLSWTVQEKILFCLSFTVITPSGRKHMLERKGEIVFTKPVGDRGPLVLSSSLETRVDPFVLVKERWPFD